MYDFSRKDPQTEFHQAIQHMHVVQHSDTHGGCFVLLRTDPFTQSKDTDYFCGFYGKTIYRGITMLGWLPEESRVAKKITPAKVQEIMVNNDYHGGFFMNLTDDQAWEKFQEVLRNEGLIDEPD